MHLTPEPERGATFDQINSGSSMHYPENLSPILKRLERPIPRELIKRYRRFAWKTSLRYKSGRTSTGETQGFLKTAQQTYDWVEEELS